MGVRLEVGMCDQKLFQCLEKTEEEVMGKKVTKVIFGSYQLDETDTVTPINPQQSQKRMSAARVKMLLVMPFII